MTPKYKVIDSHVHLCPLENIHYLDISQDDILYRNHTLKEYMQNNTFPLYDKQGIIVIEMNVKSSVDEQGWQFPLEEFLYHCKLLHAPQRSNNISDPEQFIRGIIPWAPIPLGYTQVEKYIKKLRSIVSTDSFAKVKGFRYLLQDKPPKTMLQPDFLDGLKYLNENKFVFDLGIDLQGGGLYQFSESYDLLYMFPQMTFIINHLSKPNFCLDKPNEEFKEWEYHINRISKIGNSYVKLSGFFEELPHNFVEENNMKNIIKKLRQWFKIILEVYGTKRILFGSNWPMDNTNGDRYDPHGFNKWGQVLEALLDEFDIDMNAREDIYFNNCVSLYNL